MPTTTYETVTTKQTLNRVQEERMPFDWSINPYRGCAHGCSFCYARAFQSFMGLGAEDEFQFRIMMKNNAAEALEKQLSGMARKLGHDIDALGRQIGQVTTGTATDPYQPIEGKAEITRACLKVLAKYRISTSITTRSPLVLRDLDILTQMKDVSVNISINTLDPGIIRKLEPASPHPHQRLEALLGLSEAGIQTGIFAAPVLPLITDEEEGLRQLLMAAKERGAAFAMISLLRLSKDVKRWYLQTLKEQFPDKLASYYELYRGPYAEEGYVRSFKQMAAKLLAQCGMNDGSAPAQPRVKAASTRKLPRPSAEVTVRELTPEVEQLSFPF
ncbi:SPL family radical SAM protein [Paenibacillus campinasensis]|uniref:Radical SAM protein n=1 Tax=Paenibacillus campinasensis TaxID=66347 RepID=A0A268EX48_9BACL|nr:radical SAM protein [Paenibacillus campinasensis]PAD77697.1 radical SAM protein [Paenibacillus campinasensis]